MNKKFPKQIILTFKKYFNRRDPLCKLPDLPQSETLQNLFVFLNVDKDDIVKYKIMVKGKT